MADAGVSAQQTKRRLLVFLLLIDVLSLGFGCSCCYIRRLAGCLLIDSGHLLVLRHPQIGCELFRSSQLPFSLFAIHAATPFFSPLISMILVLLSAG